jgi:tryptophan synthase beta chain
MEIFGDYPDVVVACVGGGSNFGGFTYPFMSDRLDGSRPKTRFVAAEPTACPTLTRGKYAYDYPDTARTSPVMMMHTVGNTFMPPPIHAGGLRHHADAPSLCLLADHGHIEARAYTQSQVFSEAVRFARNEGFIIAPESSHALRAAVDEAIAAREAGMEILGISLVTNLAAGMSGEPLNHEEVLEAGKAAASRMGELLVKIVPGI